MTPIDRIIAGGEELFLTAGIKSVTMDDIARHLGMSKKTIYQFFKDKNELVIALVKKKIAEDEAQMNEIISRSANVIEEMINMMKCSEEIVSRINTTRMPGSNFRILKPVFWCIPWKNCWPKG